MIVRRYLLQSALCASLLTWTLSATAHASERCFAQWFNAYEATGDWPGPYDDSSDPPPWAQGYGPASVECGGRVGYVGISLRRGSVGEVDAWVCDDREHNNCGQETIPPDDPNHYVGCYAQIQADNPACPGTKLDDGQGQVSYGYEMRDYSNGPLVRTLAMDENGQRLICAPAMIRAVCITNN